METVFIRSGKVVSLTGTPILDSTSTIIGYNGVTATGQTPGKYKDSPYSTFQAFLTGAGPVSATISILASNDNVHWCATPLGTITLTGAGGGHGQSDGFTTAAPWKYIAVNVTALTGTLATVVVLMGT